MSYTLTFRYINTADTRRDAKRVNVLEKSIQRKTHRGAQKAYVAIKSHAQANESVALVDLKVYEGDKLIYAM